MLREDAGLTQASVAASAEMKEPNYRKLEHGNVAMPTPRTISRLAAAFGMSADEFLSALARQNVTRPTSVEERDRVRRVLQAVERVDWTEDRELGVLGLLDGWRKVREVR